MTMKRTCKNILITGATQGIGYFIAKILSQNNYIFITGRNELKLRENALKFNARGYLSSDLTKRDNIEILYQKAVETLGHIDVLINNAGQYVYSRAENTTDENIDTLILLNTIAPYKLSQKVIPQMKQQKFGRIINIGSISGIVGEGNASLYSMTKSALTGFSKALALELAEFNITVNTVNPGFVDTNLLDNETFKADFSQPELLEMIPQRRFVHPEEVARLCEYLISDYAKGITGQSVNVCAGLTLG